MKRKYLFVILFEFLIVSRVSAQQKAKDSIVYRIIYKDTIVYKYDTVHIKHYVHSDTIYSTSAMTDNLSSPPKKKGVINSAQWGIGPSIGAYYSPFNGFDMNIGFGIQYYFLSIPSIRNPHLGHKRRK